MGVHGLWRLIEPSGKPVPLETLENKVLAVDISIWLHQAVKGFQDSKGASVPNAHLLGIYHRVCKLLYFRIKPVFVFDGGVPALKKQTIAKRTQSKLRNVAEADKIQRQLLNTLLKHTAVSKVLTEKIEASIGTVTKVSPKQNKDSIYMLPPTQELDSTFSSSEDESYSESSTTDSSPTKNWDLHTIDMNSSHFKSLPVDVRHDILTDLKETRKQSSWGRLHELPKVSDDFSAYQMNRLRKRQAVQVALEEAEKEMGGKTLSLAELESMLKDHGVINNQDVGKRIASDETTKYLLVKDVKKAMEEARVKELESKNKNLNATNDLPIINKKDENPFKTKADIEYEDDLKRAIAMSLENEISTSEEPVASDLPSTSSSITPERKTYPADFSFLDNFTDADFVSSSSDEEQNTTQVTKAKLSSAQSYMMEYSGLTPNEIAKIIKEKASNAAVKNTKTIKDILPTISESTEKILETQYKVNEKQSHADKTDAVIGSDKPDDLVKIKDSDDDSVKIKDSDHDSVEIMSSTESSDSEMEEKLVTKKEIEIVVNPSQGLDDDLFSDIFQKTENSDSNFNSDLDLKNTVMENKIESQKFMDIVINPNEQLDKEDDLFGDIFNPDNKNKIETDAVNVNNDKSTENERKTSSVFQQISLDGEANVDIHDGEDNIKKAKNMDLVCIKEPDKKEKCEITDSLAANKIDNETEKNRKPRTDIGDDQKLDELLINNFKKSQKQSMTEEELTKLKKKLQREKTTLLNEKSSKERIAGSITDQMYQEAQELLELFGVPYIIAPMEAEAQCAFLDEIDLTDGTITDDSDIWLFGGKTVYKNFFNQSKFVMEFKADNIKHHFKLTREQMILLALLVGSDYTVGLQGVGPVTAVEILAAFPPTKRQINEFKFSYLELLSGLKEFRSWFLKGKSAGAGRNSLKSKLKNLTFTENFPSLQVVEAYLEPKVETSREAFSWGKPNIMALIEFARDKFGWTKTKAEDILNPVIKRLEESRNQKSIKDYFKTRFIVDSGAAESKMSKRVKTAVTNMGRDPSEIIAEELEEELKKEPKKKRLTRKKTKDVEAPEFTKKTKLKTTENALEDIEDNVGQSDNKSSKSNRDIRKRNTNKINLKNIKPKSIIPNNPTPSTSQIEDSEYTEGKVEVDEVDISEKISNIRKRRKLKEVKAAVDIKKPKLSKETSKKVKSQFQEVIPKGLEADEEVNLLSQIAIHSDQKVNEINKTLQNKIESLNKSIQEKIESLKGKSVQMSKASTSHLPSSVSQSAPDIRRPISRPTRVPRKEVIPQKEKDKTILLRNKLKAIEAFRKGKHGPGYVPKKERKKRLPKADAELSESSDE